MNGPSTANVGAGFKPAQRPSQKETLPSPAGGPLHNYVIPAKAGIHRPLSERKGTRASEARSQGYAGGDEGTDGFTPLWSKTYTPLSRSAGEGPGVRARGREGPEELPQPKIPQTTTTHPSNSSKSLAS